jgi:hypothetical protein
MATIGLESRAVGSRIKKDAIRHCDIDGFLGINERNRIGYNISGTKIALKGPPLRAGH